VVHWCDMLNSPSDSFSFAHVVLMQIFLGVTDPFFFLFKSDDWCSIAFLRFFHEMFRPLGPLSRGSRVCESGRRPVSYFIRRSLGCYGF
jgi:hypothetical protein